MQHVHSLHLSQDKGSTTHLQALQISVHLLLQMGSDQKNTAKTFRTRYLLFKKYKTKM